MAACQGWLKMYEDYIDGKREIRDINNGNLTVDMLKEIWIEKIVEVVRCK